MKTRLLAVLLALPLVAFDCGGKEEVRSPVGCTLHVGGAVSEDLWCIVAAYDYTQMPTYPVDEWAFELVAYRGAVEVMEVAGGVGMFLGGRPELGTPYGWDEATASALLSSGSAERWDGAPYYPTTHNAVSVIGTGTVWVEFRAIPPASATNEELIGVHGMLTGVLPAVTGGDPVTFTATF